MLELDVRDNIAEVLRRVEHRKAVVPVALSNALNTTVFKVREAEVTEMQRVFDRPTRYTLNSLFIFRATAANPAARVYLKENVPGRHYLRPEIFGAGRLPKAFEYVMRQAGVLPKNMYAVPGSGAKIDQYGNMSRGQLLQVMSALRLAERTSGYSANRSARSKRRNSRRPEYFVGQPGGGKLPLGVWQVVRFGMGSAVKPILIFVKQPVYTPRFNFHAVANAAASKIFPQEFASELRRLSPK